MNHGKAADRGQGSTEYLMTYGWAILVVLVVGIAMWRLGVFAANPSALSFTGFSKIKPQLAGTGLSTDGVFKSVFYNGLGAPITVYNVTVNNTMKRAVCDSVSNPAPPHTSYPLDPVSGGANFELNLYDCGNGTSSEKYVLEVEIFYSANVGSVVTNHSESGSIRGAYE